MQKNTKKNTKKISDKKADREKAKIIAKADETKGEQLTITPEGEMKVRKELKDFLPTMDKNPDKMYDVYYKGIQKLLKIHLPKGVDSKKARTYIYEEKNVYLTRGKRINKIGIRGHDGRMAHTSDAEEMLKIIVDWISQNGTMLELFNTLHDMNIKKGYGRTTLI